MPFKIITKFLTKWSTFYCLRLVSFNSTRFIFSSLKKDTWNYLNWLTLFNVWHKRKFVLTRTRPSEICLFKQVRFFTQKIKYRWPLNVKQKTSLYRCFYNYTTFSAELYVHQIWITMHLICSFLDQKYFKNLLMSILDSSNKGHALVREQ